MRLTHVAVVLSIVVSGCFGSSPNEASTNEENATPRPTTEVATTTTAGIAAADSCQADWQSTINMLFDGLSGRTDAPKGAFRADSFGFWWDPDRASGSFLTEPDEVEARIEDLAAKQDSWVINEIKPVESPEGEIVVVVRFTRTKDGSESSGIMKAQLSCETATFTQVVFDAW